jgi:hypothetical protein
LQTGRGIPILIPTHLRAYNRNPRKCILAMRRAFDALVKQSKL